MSGNRPKERIKQIIKDVQHMGIAQRKTKTTHSGEWRKIAKKQKRTTTK